LFVKGYQTRKATISMIRSHLSLLASHDFRPDLIIVDYADIVKPERRLGEMRHEQAGIYEDLRTLAGDFDAAVWTGSQAKVGALEKETLTIADFAESFEKAAIVDAAVGFCQTTDERIDQKCRLYMAALRNQEDGSTVECSIFRDRCMITSSALLDAAYTRIDRDGDDQEQQPNVKTVSRVHKATLQSIKTEAGITRPKPYRKPVVNSSAPKTAPKPTKAKRKFDGPRKKVDVNAV
jgi:replicative DNA helicase